MKRITLLLSVTTVFFLLFPISLIRKGFVAQNQSYPISGDYEIDLFDLWNDGTCYSSSYSITNLSSNYSADTTHYFYIEGSGTPVVTYQDPLSLLPSETRVYDLVAIPDLPTDFSGHVIVKSNQPITGEVLPFPPCEITVSGPPILRINTILKFTAKVTPEDALLPITYIWIPTDLPPVKHTSGFSDSVEFSWGTSGWKLIYITAENSRGKASVRVLCYVLGLSKVYLPITIMKNNG